MFSHIRLWLGFERITDTIIFIYKPFPQYAGLAVDSNKTNIISSNYHHIKYYVIKFKNSSCLNNHT